MMASDVSGLLISMTTSEVGVVTKLNCMVSSAADSAIIKLNALNEILGATTESIALFE